MALVSVVCCGCNEVMLGAFNIKHLLLIKGFIRAGGGTKIRTFWCVWMYAVRMRGCMCECVCGSMCVYGVCVEL